MNKVDKVKPNVTLIPMKFTPKAYEIYGASDIFVTKAGPNSILDSLYMGTPVVIDFFAHPIEKGTASLFVDRLKVGIRVIRNHRIKSRITFLYKHPEFLQKLKDNIALNIRRDKDGAKEIADIIYEEALKIESKEDYGN